ncbi:hypothetical protein V5268_005593 [Escherichia coli]
MKSRLKTAQKCPEKPELMQIKQQVILPIYLSAESSCLSAKMRTLSAPPASDKYSKKYATRQSFILNELHLPDTCICHPFLIKFYLYSRRYLKYSQGQVTDIKSVIILLWNLQLPEKSTGVTGYIWWRSI